MTSFMRLLAVVLLVIAGAVGATAQTGTGTDLGVPDYAAWNKVAKRAEDAVASERASDKTYLQLRTEIVDWRSRFQDALNANASRIRTLRDQIAALGPPPAEGEVEAEDIAARRTKLNDQLSTFQAPGLRADESYRQADSLVSEIDRILRERQADKLLELGPSPLNPLNWQSGLTALSGTFVGIGTEIWNRWTTTNSLTTLKTNLPLTLFFLVLAAVLLARGWRWIERLTNWLLGRTNIRGRAAAAGLISLGQIIVPFVGLVALLLAVQTTGLMGDKGTAFLALMPALGLTIFTARWLGNRIFPKADGPPPMFNITPEHNAEARWYAGIFGLLIALSSLLQALADSDRYPLEAKATLSFPLFVVAAFAMIRFGRIIVSHAQAELPEGEERPYRDKVIGVVGRVVRMLGPVGVVLAAIGYLEAASFIILPTLKTLALAGGVLVVQRFVVGIYAAILRLQDDTSEALFPVMTGLTLALLSLPVLALIWGARVSDLAEVWIRFTVGFTVGDTRISPSNFLTLIVVFGIGYGLTRLLQGMLRNSVLPKTRIDIGGQKAMLSGLGYVGIFLAGLLAINSAGIDLTALGYVAGALSVGIGFGLQNIVSNFVSGIILLIERPVSEGDWIEVGGVMGIVRSISVRSTRVETFDRTDVIVPNSDLISGTVTNWTKSNLTGRLILRVGVAYGTDTRKVEQILKEVAVSHPVVIANPEPQVLFMGFGADSLDFEIRLILRDVGFILTVQSEMNHEINRRFTEEGIEIPFAQRDVWLRNPETLTAPRVPATPPADPAQAMRADFDAGTDDGEATA